MVRFGEIVLRFIAVIESVPFCFVCEERERKKLKELVGRDRRENVILV